MTPKSRPTPSPTPLPRHIAVVGAGMAGVACARTLVQAGHRVTVFEKSRGPGGRMATRNTEFGGFDHGTQYFTVRDSRFEKALASSPGLVRPWSANTVRILDEAGRVVAASLPPKEAHWVATPGMNALLKHWAQPLAASGSLALETQVSRIEPDTLHPERWQLQTEGPGADSRVYSGFDAVVLAVPAPQAHALLLSSQHGKTLMPVLAGVSIAPCWTLMLAFPQAMQPTLQHLGPHWNAARSTHHRIAWLARESSKPGRGAIERWTVQASPEWSERHLEDDAERVKAKLLKAFTEVTGIRAQPSHADVHRWRYAQATQPLDKSHVWDARSRIGACGDWCLGHRVEEAFVSGLEMALKIC
ncbi:NAD(P)/FAD-dependent oxidoreductase [Polaromonas sp.]|uniref:NAD(P)/FAD-dependent oxidoreductase n=1 Tax=Polaromonas sp. TaxID=1869339 RepID=UPI00273012C3|nr:FAD-dependent oxidoreductase [Polaromonas sp.]MDP1739998.1 FAD-dependent oxidoreductase [Polaromonas sp.]